MNWEISKFIVTEKTAEFKFVFPVVKSIGFNRIQQICLNVRKTFFNLKASAVATLLSTTWKSNIVKEYQ